MRKAPGLVWEGFLEEGTAELCSKERGKKGKSTLGKRTGRCKGPEAGICLQCFLDGKRASVGRAQLGGGDEGGEAPGKLASPGRACVNSEKL